MAKATNNKMTQRRPRNRKKKSQKMATTSESRLDAAGLAHANLLYDPCGADLVPSVYPGDRGYVNRFVYNASLGASVGATVWYLIIKPGNQITASGDNTSSTLNNTITYVGASYPGFNFLTTNAAKARTAAACVVIRPVSSPNSATGTIHFGVVNAQAVSNGIVATTDQMIQLCSESVSASQALLNPLEIKWSPGSFDDRYSAPFTADDDNDRNVILVVGTGFPAFTGIQYRITGVVEWAPKGSLGIVNDATSIRPSICDKECVLQALKSRDRDWWWSLGKKAVGFAKSVSAGYWNNGAIGALGGAVKFMTN